MELWTGILTDGLECGAEAESLVWLIDRVSLLRRSES